MGERAPDRDELGLGCDRAVREIGVAEGCRPRHDVRVCDRDGAREPRFSWTNERGDPEAEQRDGTCDKDRQRGDLQDRRNAPFGDDADRPPGALLRFAAPDSSVQPVPPGANRTIDEGAGHRCRLG